MNIETFLRDGLSYVGSSDAVRQTYYVYEASEVFVVFSLSATKQNSGNFNFVTKKSVEYIYKRFSGYEEISSKDVFVRARRTKHVANTLAALNILYVLVAQGKARVQNIGSHSKLFFDMGPIPKRRRPRKKRVTKKR